MKNLDFGFRKAFLFVFAVFSFHQTQAVVCTFTNGGGDKLWHNAANWNTGIIPDNDDDAIISSGSLTINLDINVKSLSISSGATVTFTHPGTSYIKDLKLAAGDLSSTNKIIISGSLIWTGDSSITSSSDFELASTAVSSISGSGNRNLYAPLINNGSCSHTGGSLRLQTGGSFDNNGTYTLNGATFIINTGGGSFTNAGIFNKNGSADLNFFANFDQTGTGKLNINTGVFKLLWGGTLNGNSMINISSGATMNISSGIYNFGINTSLTGAGDLEIQGGTPSFNGMMNLTGTLNMSGGTASFNSTNTNIEDLSLSSGILQGSGKVIVNNHLNWSGSSTISCSDSLKIESTATASIFGSGSKKLYAPLLNEGIINHSAGTLRIYTGGSVINDGTYTANGPTSMSDDGGDAFENNGTFEHLQTGTFTFFPNFKNNLNGIVKSKGTIVFKNLSNLGSFTAEADYGTFNIDGNFNNGTALNIGFDDAAHGDLVVSGNVGLSGKLNVTSTGTVPFGTYNILTASGGTITGTFEDETIPAGFSIQYLPTEVNMLVGLLPVELTFFKAKAQPRMAFLQWQTASELNSKNFLIEHSIDGQEFHTIGEVKAAGNSTVPKDYRFIHEEPLNGINYYRLRQQDLDGSHEYSDIRVVNFYRFDKDISIFPNPTQGNVIIKNQNDSDFDLTILDMKGVVVYVRKGIAPGAISLDLGHLPKAMYTLEFSDGAQRTHKGKLMILE